MEAQAERCDMCGATVAPGHRHLLELARRELRCACRPCSILFHEPAASEGRYKLVPERREHLADAVIDDATWEQLRLPVDIAFLFASSTDEERMLAFYPGPMGATESLLDLAAWERIQAEHPVLATLQSDVEALLVNRTRAHPGQWIVPIDDCFRLVGVIRTRWRGFTGGREVWEEIAAFFEELDRTSTQPEEVTWPP